MDDDLKNKVVYLDKDGYQYRLDSLWMFQEISEHVERCIDYLYEDDNAVKRDTDVQNFNSFLNAEVPRFTTKF